MGICPTRWDWGTVHRAALHLFVLIPTPLGAAHHVDHVIRGNHVGWPITPHVNPFTYSLAIYALLAISLYPAFGVVLALIGSVLVGSAHGAALWYRDDDRSMTAT